MDEGAKNKLILILGILAVLFSLTSIVSCANSQKQRAGRNREIATRLDLEEKMSVIEREKEAMGRKLDALAGGLETEREARQAAEKLLLQEQSLNQNLQAELEKISRLKETLEEDLKEALVNKGKIKK